MAFLKLLKNEKKIGKKVLSEFCSQNGYVVITSSQLDLASTSSFEVI